jgi:hypothetical protein
MLLTGLVLWSRMMAGVPWCLGVICLESVSRFPSPSRSRSGSGMFGPILATASRPPGEAMDSGVAATRKSERVTHISRPLAFGGSAAQWYRWPYDPRPAQARNPPGLTSCETPGAAQ